MGFPFFPSLISLFIFLSIHSTSSQQPPVGFRCTNTTTCNSIIDYKLPNTTTLSAIQTLFQIKNFRSLLAVNNLPQTTPLNQSVESLKIIKIPFQCSCRNGRGISNLRPNYTVVPNDGLYHIAAEVFSRLVTVQQIQEVNGIVNPDKILAGQELWIPLPCSCDDVGGEKVVHYGHTVAARSTVAGIASEFNTTETTLLDLNGMRNSSELMADSIIDVPLRVCTSSVKNDTMMDYPLLVPNGTYIFTANNCVQCQCNAANNWILECEPSGINIPKGQTCPSTQCAGTSFHLGNTTSESNCSREKCAYSGYRNGTIYTTLTPESTCPENNENSNNPSGNGSKNLKSSFVVGASLTVLHLLKW